MLFLNRRGYAPLTLCRTCGHRMQCPNCTAWLVEHRTRHLLQCHHCGHAIPIPQACPSCGAAHSLTPVGPGVERITEEAALAFPSARLLVMASDTLPGPHAAAEAARAVAEREIDLIIGTQIVAKGWHFPHLVLVGVVDADLGLGGADLRAAERTVQLLHQVAGRAGRADSPGRVLLQTFSPEHPVMQALLRGDLAEFQEQEIAERMPGGWPPFGRLAALIVSADSAEQADLLASALGRAAPHADGVTVFGPAPAPLAVLRGRHRRRLLLKTCRDIAGTAHSARVAGPRTIRPRRPGGGGRRSDLVPVTNSQAPMICRDDPGASCPRSSRQVMTSAHKHLLHSRTATILLVDDDEAVREVASELLEDAGYTILQAENALAAMRLIEFSFGN